MLLDSNTKKVINLLDMFNKLSNTDKIRLATYIMENKNFYKRYNYYFKRNIKEIRFKLW